MLYTRHGEYSPIVFAADIRLADQAARRQGWRPHGRTGWMKPDGIVVQFVCFGEQLAVSASMSRSTVWASCRPGETLRTSERENPLSSSATVRMTGLSFEQETVQEGTLRHNCPYSANPRIRGRSSTSRERCLNVAMAMVMRSVARIR